MRKHRIKWLIALIIALPITAYGATYTLVSAGYPINVNGQKIAVQPLNYNGTTYLPLRSISEAVGVPIEWNSAKKSVEINTLDVGRLKEACVMIFADDGKTYTQGSGVYTDYDEVLTAYHVVDGGRDRVRTSLDQNDPDKMVIVASNGAIDIAVLKPTAEKKPVKIGDSDEVKVGDMVVIISSPKLAEDTVIYTTVKKLTNEIVVSAAPGKGSSGGALFNIHGELVGIIIAGDAGLNETYFTPINDIRKAL